MIRSAVTPTHHGRTIESPVGRLVLATNGGELTHLLYEGRDPGPQTVAPYGEGVEILDETERQLREYFAGRRCEFDLSLAPEGTAFQLAVWEALQGIRWGETIAYGELARRVGRPRAVRAVGAANGANPISIIVPCHRVIGANGKLTGYGGGLPAKRRLLDLEGVE